MEQPFPKYALFNGKLHTFVKRVEPVPRTTHHRNCETPGASAAEPPPISTVNPYSWTDNVLYLL